MKDIDSGRPATVRVEDIQRLEFNDDDEGWAGAQAEVDYGAKLKFEDSDESESDEEANGRQKSSEKKRGSPEKEMQRVRNGPANVRRHRQVSGSDSENGEECL